MEVKGVVTTFMATVDVIRQAISTWEQILLSHMSQPGFQGQMIQNGFLDDPVYLEKKEADRRSIRSQSGDSTTICIWM